MASIARKLKVDITSDTICPFCVLGVRQLQVAIDKYKTAHPQPPVDVQLNFHPFQLGGPGKFTETPQPRCEYSYSRFGKERTDQFNANFDRQYRALGLDKFEPDGLLASSHLGHRLTAYAQEHKPEAAAPLAIELMKNYQVRGKSPSDRDELARIATELGVFPSATAAKEWLATDDKDAEVRRDYDRAVREGISGVPFFVFQDKYALSGAVGVDQFEGVLEQILAKEN